MSLYIAKTEYTTLRYDMCLWRIAQVLPATKYRGSGVTGKDSEAQRFSVYSLAFCGQSLALNLKKQ